MSKREQPPPEFNSWTEVWEEHQSRGKELVRLASENKELRAALGAALVVRASVWTETPGVQISVASESPAFLLLSVEDIHNKTKQEYRIASFRCDLLAGPIIRQWLELQRLNREAPRNQLKATTPGGPNA